MSRIITRRELYRLSSDEAAALWLVRRSGEGPIGDVSMFEDWLAASSQNRDAWDRASRMWHRFDDAPDDVFEDLRREALAAVPEAASKGSPKFAFMAAAAAVLFVLSFGLVFRFFADEPSKQAQLASSERSNGSALSTGRGQYRSLTLTDGTKVQLDAETTVRLAYRPGERRIMLDRGQAFFDVAHDASRPFTVRADGRTVTAIGTRFTVRNDPRLYQVALLQGRVRIDGRKNVASVTLMPGEKFVATGKLGTVSSLDAERITAWTQRQVEFDDSTLSDAVAEMNRYSAMQIVVTDAALGRMRVSGRFRTGDWKGFSTMVAKVLPLRVVHISSTRTELRPAR